MVKMNTRINIKIDNEKLILREVSNDDLAAVLLLNHHLHENEPKREIDTEISAVWEQILTDKRIKCFVAEIDREVVASCIIDIVPNLTRGVRPFGVLQNVVTHQDFRGKGIGKKLNLYALEYAWSQNCYQVLVQTGRPEVTSFYERLGFRPDKIGLVAKPEWRVAV